LSAGRAQSLGYQNVFVMAGGRKAWAEAGLPLISDDEPTG
jgi:3-mercaptopyruvate sulfurtransferase SseA